MVCMYIVVTAEGGVERVEEVVLEGSDADVREEAEEVILERGDTDIPKEAEKVVPEGGNAEVVKEGEEVVPVDDNPEVPEEGEVGVRIGGNLEVSEEAEVAVPVGGSPEVLEEGEVAVPIGGNPEVPEEGKVVVPEVNVSQVPEEPEANVPGADEEEVPKEPESNVPEADEDEVPEESESIVPEADEEEVPEEPETNVPEADEEDVPEQPETNVPDVEEAEVRYDGECEGETDGVPDKECVDEMIMTDATEIASSFATDLSDYRTKEKKVVVVRDSPMTRSRKKNFPDKRPPKRPKTLKDSKITAFYRSVSLIQYRCRIATYITTMKDVIFEKSVMERILGTPFGHFLDAQPMVVNNFQLDDLCGRFVSNYSFALKKKQVRVIVEDVGKIPLIPYRGTPVDLVRANNDTTLWNKFFEKGRRTKGRCASIITCKDTIATLRIESKKRCASKEEVDDLYRLWLVVLFSKFLLPSSKMGFNGKVLSYIDNLDELLLINWVE
ncbi:hypothetical protein ZOSMA_71G00240 [Zostera marina]|uniref:Uncharacterized protein n=1 Tax=Zostera marina TaxID=29655 RepID=A0A0K9NQR1_ZOSMR|nr:hypothetical protein ZOSMA_71G00240 [Zostera marina]